MCKSAICMLPIQLYYVVLVESLRDCFMQLRSFKVIMKPSYSMSYKSDITVQIIKAHSRLGISMKIQNKGHSFYML